MEFSSQAFWFSRSLTEISSTREYLCCNIPSTVISCKPLPSQLSLSTCSYILSHNILRIIIWILGNLAVIENAISIVWHSPFRKDGKCVPKVLIVNLSIADFLMGVYLIIVASANTFYAQRYSEFVEVWLRSPACLISCFLISLSCLTSTIILLLITVDRFLYLVFPFTSYRLRYSLLLWVLIAVWSISIAFIAVPIASSFGQSSYYRLYGTNSACLPGNVDNYWYLTWLILYCGFTFAVWIIIAVLYILIIKSLTQSRRKTKQSLSNIDKIATAKMVTVVITDLICWLPFYVIITRVLLGYGLDIHTLPFIAVLALPLNSCINPIIYTIFTKKFTNYVNSYLTCYKCYNRQYHASMAIYTTSIISKNAISKLNVVAKEDTGFANFQVVILNLGEFPLKSGYIRAQFINKNGKTLFALIKLYNKAERKLWEKEVHFYRYVHMRRWCLLNVSQCLWICEGKKCHIPLLKKDRAKLLDKFGTFYHPAHFWAELYLPTIIPLLDEIQFNEIDSLTCYYMSGNELQSLKEMLEYNSKHLSPTVIVKIILDIAIAIKSLHSNMIVHGNIGTHAILLITSHKEQQATALLSEFSHMHRLQLITGSKQNETISQLMCRDINGLVSLTEALSLYCQIDKNRPLNDSEVASQGDVSCDGWELALESLQHIKSVIYESQHHSNIKERQEIIISTIEQLFNRMPEPSDG
ncbi:uncharacterized protein TRIADDRAFT_60495 [Trichoplax adhaerens]|uniref:G-protein coupled receptors family 1 profile domain-containing protein n=1 Tax=Trichoplax adhaerens TaxID=10228 RepID=B3S8D1_TRIAD|nr:hypothetical protein TRIADDRAFT_60495 [Trichoplax adhaerens]EDV21082.1 hypothetical protein TRIADDRAFT_60495 [Trichoplax adhaerens]|eukprot:XP_002116412.1 hypothetical protein TRIADDRAFT_60495 [Trichoplax adhaerens]